MVIFRIFFNLFRIVTRGFFNIFWLPLSMISHSPMLFLVLVAVAAWWLFSASDDQTAKRAQQANPARIVTMQDGSKQQIASPVRRVENGDSAFANDLYVQMTKEERAQYSQIFFHVMSTLPDGETHQWSAIDMAGAIVPDNSFTNKTGERCRMFAETLKVHSVQQQITGMACAEGGGSWCKLKANATPACNLSSKPGALDSIGSSLRRLF